MHVFSSLQGGGGGWGAHAARGKYKPSRIGIRGEDYLVNSARKLSKPANQSMPRATEQEAHVHHHWASTLAARPVY